ncbi:MAG: alanine racemase [Solirubrobacteraceae bacterium]
MPVRALARINLAAVERNVRQLRSSLQPGAALCAVVKADGYGHGAVRVARAAQEVGATWLAVVTATEAAELRAAGLEGPLLIMGALSRQELPVALAAGGDLVAWTDEFVDDVLAALAQAPRGEVGIHVKLDTGMGRLGTRNSGAALQLAERLAGEPGLELRGVMTHLATADEDPEFLAAQLNLFAPFVEQVRQRWPGALVHAANSAAILNSPASHFDFVRAGIALYGCDPMGVDPAQRGLEPVLELSSYVAALKPARPGESAGYGRRFIATQDTTIATVPLGYADGFIRALGNNCDVLIGGRRHPVVGTVSMDNLTVDVGSESGLRVGDRVTVIGTDGSERQTAEEVARRVGTLNYELLCGISARVPRAYHRDGSPA